jgi:hypothetical protein
MASMTEELTLCLKNGGRRNIKTCTDKVIFWWIMFGKRGKWMW